MCRTVLSKAMSMKRFKIIILNCTFVIYNKVIREYLIINVLYLYYVLFSISGCSFILPFSFYSFFHFPTIYLSLVIILLLLLLQLCWLILIITIIRIWAAWFTPIYLGKWWISRFRDVYRTRKASEMELFVILVNTFL